MIAFTWRQFRSQATVGIVALAVIAAVLVVTGPHLVSVYDHAVAACRASGGQSAACNNPVTSTYGGLRIAMITLVLVVPALKPLYGSIDRAIGHFRRYTRADLLAKLDAAGLEVETVRYFNAVGVPGWFVNTRLLRRRSVPGVQARINDWLVPLLRLEQRVGLPFGMSLLVVGRVPA